MAAKRVFLFPGFLSSDLGILGLNEVVWWDPSYSMIVGIGTMRLAANGIDPGPPDGLVLATAGTPQNPWPSIAANLQSQLNPDDWTVSVVPYDWRLSAVTHATTLANTIAANATPSSPVTLCGHSLGGIICTLAWSQLVAMGKSNLVRRLITMGTPFQGSYGSILWLNGTLGAVEQLLAVSQLAAIAAAVIPARWTLGFLSNVALTWPAFYQLYPALEGSEADRDPNRAALYDTSKYLALYHPSQSWLDHSKDTFQPLLRAPDSFPPPWVATCVYGTGVITPYGLKSDAAPLNLFGLSLDDQGDGVVTKGSAIRTGALEVQVTSAHWSMPVGITQSGLLAQLITDPRAAPTPTPPPVIVAEPIPDSVEEPPSAQDRNPALCIGGG